MRQEILNLNRGSDGVGSVTMYRNFIRTFGLDSAVVLSDFIRAYLWCEKNKTLEGNFFHWNKNNICNNLKFHPNRFFEALEIIYKSGLLKIKKNSEDEIMFELNFEQLKKYGEQDCANPQNGIR